eukprot:CAMPEP_0170092444 /NCGR_PEP_ID=MMETSP0019_2-20121128/25810_1 /TAXON_ID=98059 /ORGANISM="Dinobryon sp., Strain UTEXLB2267" /LENGTH=404 /DNA_ID=CAMNT_0010312877 /DNA_START=243 /DNA_END=1456 /DNA_ORIENTATION=+
MKFLSDDFLIKVDCASVIKTTPNVQNKDMYDPLLDAICKRILNPLNSEEEQSLQSNDAVAVTVSGMSAIFSALRLALEWHGKSSLSTSPAKMVVFGFPYVDTLKLLSRPELNPGGVTFFGQGDAEDLQSLRVLLQQAQGQVAAIFTEFPTNPLLKCPDLTQLTALAAEFDCLLVVDDTISGFANVDLFRSPGGVGGYAVLKPHEAVQWCGQRDGRRLDSEWLRQTRRGLEGRSAEYAVPDQGDIPPLALADLVPLELNSRDYSQRCARINRTALQLAEWLETQPAVERVYYPGTAAAGGDMNYRSVLRGGEDSGFGCLVSLVLKPQYSTQRFHDALKLHKGPSLGTNFSLLCPYTLLAHYNELDWAETFGVSRNLLRLSVGLESFENLRGVFEYALNEVTVADS